MATFAQLWDEPTATRSGGSEDVAPKKSKFSTYVSGTPIGSAPTATFADLWESTPTTEAKPTEAKPSKGVVANALEAAFKARDIFRGAIAEPVATLLTGAQAPIIGGITGKIAEARSPQFGTPQGRFIAEEQAKNYAEQTTYQPRTETGKAVVGALGEAAQKLSGTGPVPELLGFAPLAEAAGRQAITGVKALNAELPRVRIEKVGQVGEQPTMTVAEQLEAQRTNKAFSPALETLEQQKAVKGTPAPTFKVPEENPPMPTAPLSAPEISNREAALRKVGIENVRKSALENNPKEASSQFITSQASQEPYGQGMTQQINYEKSKLDEHFSNIEKESGGHVVRYGTKDQVSDQIRTGKTLKESLNKGYKDWEKEGSNLYKEADKVHGGKPVELSNTKKYLSNDSNFAYEAERSLKNGIMSYLKDKGLLNKDKSIKPMTVSDAEGLRQYINSKYNPASYGVSKDLKNLIDKEVFSQVGGETYQKARGHWAKGKATYENPKAMGDLLGDKGVNEKIADERVMTTLAGLKEKQFNHIVQTLRADKQTDAIKQIQTSLVNEIRMAGQSAVNQPYNSIAAAKRASELSEKLRVAFADNPKLLQKVYDGIEAGNIIHIPAKYPGAAVQTHLLKNKFSEMAVQKGATALGGALGGAVGSIGGPAASVAGAGGGAVLGEGLGGKITESMRSGRQQKQLGKEIKSIKLSDIGKE